MLNKAMIIGRLGQDPELRYTQDGMPVCKFSVATDESYIDKSGQKHEKTEWHKVITFQKQAENCSKYLHKGSLVFVEGSLTTNKWEGKDGKTNYSTEIKASRVQFLDSKKESTAQQYKQPNKYDDGNDPGQAFPSEPYVDDNIPF